MTVEWWFATVGAILLLAVGRLASIGYRYSGQRLITCPGNRQAAAVVVDARHAAATALGHVPRLRLSQCSRWPELLGCGQKCLRQIEDAPDDCLVASILVNWYRGKCCAWCGRPIGEIAAALTCDNRTSVEWAGIPVEQLPATLSAAKPVCLACHLAGQAPPILAVTSAPPAGRAARPSG